MHLINHCTSKWNNNVSIAFMQFTFRYNHHTLDFVLLYYFISCMHVSSGNANMYFSSINLFANTVFKRYYIYKKSFTYLHLHVSVWDMHCTCIVWESNPWPIAMLYCLSYRNFKCSFIHCVFNLTTKNTPQVEVRETAAMCIQMRMTCCCSHCRA